MSPIRFTSRIYQKLRKQGYHLFVTQTFLSHPSKIMLFPFKKTDKAIACIKSIPAVRKGQLHHKGSLMEKIAAGIMKFSYYIQMPETLSSTDGKELSR